MDQRDLIIVDSHASADVTLNDIRQFVEQLREELPNTEIHATWDMKAAAHAGDYWPEVIIWIVGDKDLVDTTVRVILITKATEALLRIMGKACIKLARFTSDNTGKVFKRVYVRRGEEPVEEDVSEDEQETVTQSPIRD